MRKNCVLVPKLKAVFCPCQEEPREQTCGFACMFNNTPDDEGGEAESVWGRGFMALWAAGRLGVWQKQGGRSNCADRKMHLDGADGREVKKAKSLQNNTVHRETMQQGLTDDLSGADILRDDELMMTRWA